MNYVLCQWRQFLWCIVCSFFVFFLFDHCTVFLFGLCHFVGFMVFGLIPLKTNAPNISADNSDWKKNNSGNNADDQFFGSNIFGVWKVSRPLYFRHVGLNIFGVSYRTSKFQSHEHFCRCNFSHEIESLKCISNKFLSHDHTCT